MLTDLSPPQHDAVVSRGHQVVFACPGSGKTHTLAVKAASLLADNHRVGAVTFTNESADELKDRIRLHYPMAGQRLVVGTFHKLCQVQMRAAGMRQPPLLAPAEQSDLVKRAWRDAAPNSLLEDIVRVIEHGKSSLLPRTANIDSDPEEAAFQFYQDRLERLGKWDIADLIRNVVLGMRERQIPPLHLGALLVDEFQDADEVQLEWVNQHAVEGVEVTVVGDDDQSLYGWRHALGYRGMMKFYSANNARLIHLDTCFRCPPNILRHAKHLIEHNGERQTKALTTHNLADGEIQVRSFATDHQQAEAVAAAVRDEPGTWVVLARTNVDLNTIDATLSTSEIPFKRIGGKPFWSGLYPALYLSVLRALALGDRTGFDMLLGQMRLREVTVDRFSKHLPPKGRRNNLDTVLERPPGLDSLPAADVSVVSSWLAYLKECVVMARGPRPDVMLLGLADRLASLFDSPAAETIFDLCGQRLCRMSGSVAQRISAIESLRREQKDPESARITLMTLHGSKGLEFDNVWLACMEENTLPHKKGEISEERRLAYVGMTRAKKKLVLSYRLSRETKSDAGKSLLPSRFIQEAGLEIES